MDETIFEIPVARVEKENITPYLSILVVKNNAGREEGEVHDEVFELIQKTSSGTVVGSERISDRVLEVGFTHYTSYNLIVKPSWLSGLDSYDLERHVFVSLVRNEFIAFYFSCKGEKDHIRDQLEGGAVEGIEFIDSSLFNSTFVNEDDVTTLWLLGIHGKDNYRAGNKVLGGGGVVDTLDPLLDQSYMMSAARTKVDLDNRSISIGVNPSKSSIWRGGCKTWMDFEGRVFEILAALENCHIRKDDPISFLSFPISSCSDAKGAYDFSIIDPAFLPEDTAVMKTRLLHKLWPLYDVTVEDGVTDNSIIFDVFCNEVRVGFLTLKYKVVSSRVKFEISSENPEKGCTKNLKDFSRIFSHPDLFKIWFDSGHAIVGGRLFKTGYTDVRYDGFIWGDFSGYDVKKEKPDDVKLEKIGYDNSLFSWVKDKWTGCWSDDSEYAKKGRGKGWLYCDDGSGEKADFIHLVEFDGMYYLSLIHVKSAKSNSSNRKISVGAHDVVINQAVKNIRYCVRKNLYNDLKLRESIAQKKHCWLDGSEKDSKEFIKFLGEINTESRYQVRVVVVQPHTKEKYYKKADTNVKKQLDVILVSAQSAVRSTGSGFYIIGSV